MLEVTKSIVCELTGYILKVVEVAHNDSGSRQVKCLLRSGGEPWAVPEGVSVAVGYTLPDGTPGLYDTMPDGTAAGTADGSTVTVQLSDAILSASGAVEVAVELRNDGAKLHTFPFRVNVIGSNSLSNPETFPALGAGFEGKLLFGGPGGTVVPLTIEALKTLLGGWTPDSGTDITVTKGEDGTVLLSVVAETDDDGTIIISGPVALAEDGTIIIGGDNIA